MKIRFWPAMAAFVGLLSGLYLLNPLDVPSLDPRTRLLGLSTYSINSSSMNPTLQRGDYILVNAARYALGVPAVGDVAVFLNPKDRQTAYVKRIVAGPGDRVKITGGQLVLNGRQTTQPYLHNGLNEKDYSREMAEHQVPADHYFMLGDNRDNSLDSRYFGDVPRANLIGRAFRIWYAQDADRIGALPDPQP
ncbi:signal peptidase I [Enterobacterales bacterium AE_CKDN230030158-1A_HGKHYDSX7]